MADQNKISDSLTQAQVDAEAIYAKAAAIDPYKAALIKKNANGNIMSAGVLDALSSLGVDAKSGVASSIANIDAATREQRLANQKTIAQQREQENFDNTKRGQVWRIAKGIVKGTTGFFGTTWQWMQGEARQGIAGLTQAAQNFGITSAAGAYKPAVSPVTTKPIPGANEQTYLGQALIKAKQNINKGKPFYTGIDTGNGFFISEETGIGHAARQASLDAAKVAIKDSSGKVIGYRPASLLGDAYASVFTLGHPESEVGNVVSLVADVAGSFAFDPGLARMSEIKALKKLASQQRAEKAFVDAAKTEERINTLQKAQDEALAEAQNLRKQAENLKITEAEAAKAELGVGKSKADKVVAADAAIKSGQGVRRAQARLDEFSTIEAQQQEALASAKEARLAAEAAFKAPKNVSRLEKLLSTQRKQLEEMQAERQGALDAGKVPFRDQESIDNLAEIIKTTEQKFNDAKAMVGESPVSAEALATAKELEKKAAQSLKEVRAERIYMESVVKERTRTESLMHKARMLAAKDDLNAVKRNATLSDKLNDARLSVKDLRKSWELAVKRISNIEQNYKRPEFAYQNFAEFLTNGHGSRALDKLVEMTDWKSIWRKAGGKLTAEQAKGIANATTKDELVDVLAPFLKRGELQAGALEPGLGAKLAGRTTNRLTKIGAAIDARTNYIMPEARYLIGVGAKTAQRIKHHEKVAKIFAGAERLYTAKVKSGALINIHDREALLRAAEDFGKAAKLPKETLDNLIEQISNAESNSVAGYTASVKLLDAVFNAAEDKVAPHLKEAFKEYTTEFKQSADKMSSYWATRHANGASLKYMTLGGESVVLPGPHLDSEMLNSTIYLPPVGEFLKLTSRLSKYKTLSGARDISDKLIGNYWKKLVLVRPAYIIRNIAEEQIRVAAVGHASFFTRPGMALAMWLGKKDGPWTRRVLHQFDTYRNTVFDKDFTTGDEALDILDETLGHGMKNSFIDMMNSNMTGYDAQDFRVLTLKGVGKVASEHPKFFEGITNQLRMLNSSEFAKVVAGYDTKFIKDAMAKGQFRQDAVIDYFLTGPGRRSLDAYLEGTPDNFKAFARTREGLKAFLYTGKNEKGVDVSILARINEMTGGNKTLQKLVAYGKTNVGGKDLVIPKPSREAINSIQNSKAMREGKKALIDSQQTLAKDIRELFKDLGNWDGVEVNVPSKTLAHMESKSDKLDFVNKFFDKATEFEKNTTFGPEFRQAYWDAINDIARALDSDAKTRLMKAAENSLNPLQKAGVNVGSKHPVWNAFKNAGKGPMTLEDAHVYADTYARNHVKELFYNAHEKRLIFHQLRLIAPFANAWEDTAKRWAELSLENPLGVYKAIKAISWTTNPESSAIYQMTDAQDYYDPNQGFFFTDPNSGQRQFFVPFAGTVMASVAKAATGVNYQGAPMAFSANPMSFNFAFGSGTFLPGIGPGVSIPLSALGTFQGNFIDALPLGIQKWLFPFGRADFSAGLQSAILPGNWNKILGGLTGLENSYASNYKPIMTYLAGGANYNLDDPNDQAQLVKDTDTFARWESVMRGIVGLVSPMGLIQQGLGKDENGDVTLQVEIYNDFQTILQKNDGDYNKAWFDFLNLYGAPQAFALISSSTGNGPSNWDSYAFVVDNPDVATKYSDIWGYVMPGGGLSTEMYQWNVAHDTKKRLTPTQILQKVNNQRYYAARDSLLTQVDAGQITKSQFSEAVQNLKASMGGGPAVEFDPSKRERVLRQLGVLVTDKRFADIPSVAGLRDYMYLRQGILEKIGKPTFTGAQNEQGARDWLAAQAEWIIKDNPDFQKMFYAFFANELEGK